MKIEKELLNDLYINKGLTQSEIATRLNCYQSTVRYFIQKYKFMKRKANEQKHWSKEDEEKLQELLGTCSYEKIAKILGRTPKAINEKRSKLELGEAKQATEYLNSNELGEALGRDAKNIRLWANKFGLPHTKKVLANERKYYRINPLKFWEWAKDNSKFMRWDLYKLGNLPNEPNWVKEEKKKALDRPVRKTWTKTEESHLLFYYNQGVILKEIGKKLNRTEKSIDQRLNKLLDNRKQIQIPWKNEEDTILTHLRNDGKPFSFIAEELGRSTDSAKARWYLIQSKKAITY